MYKAVIFDLDGTLLNSLGDILFHLNRTLAHFGLPQVEYGQAKSYIGNGARELVRRAIGGQNVDKLDEILTYYKGEYANSDNSRASLYEGEEDALKRLKSAGIKLAVLTNKPHAAALKANDVFFKDFNLDCVLGQKDGAKLKPSPEPVEEILKILQVDAKDCLLVGDGETDVLTAQNCGLACASVLWGYRTEEELRAAGATLFVSSFKTLEKIILS